MGAHERTFGIPSTNLARNTFFVIQTALYQSFVSIVAIIAKYSGQMKGTIRRKVSLPTTYPKKCQISRRTDTVTR